MRKSLVPFAGALPAAELCKRVFINGVEISCIPVKLVAKVIANGRLASQLQNHITSRLSSIPIKGALTWIGGLIDSESFQFLTILNMLPKHLSGILHPQLETISQAKLNTWYPNLEITVDAITQAYTYVAIVEQLKRLDTLLRQTQIITAAIETSAFGYSVQQISTLGWQYNDPNHPIEVIASSMPKFNATHPIVKASTVEVDRIGDLLSALRTGDKDLTAQARARLLDMFRNSLVDAWADGQAARGQAERSLIQRALTTLTDICLYRPPTLGPDRKVTSPGHTLSFTVMLAYLNRMWNINWVLNSPVTINAIKSRVAAGKAIVNTKLDGIIGNINFASNFAPQRKLAAPVSKPVAPITKSVNPHVASIDNPSKSPP